MNSENNKAACPHRLLHNILHKLDLKRSDQLLAYIEKYRYIEKYLKSHTITISLKY